MEHRQADHAHGALTQLRAWLSQTPRRPGDRLPPERHLCEELGVSRGELRKALAVMEAGGEVWRHVGKGTFLGAAPSAEGKDDLAQVAARSNPGEVMSARLLLEPVLASEAALSATAEDIAELRSCLDGARAAESWRHYETWDNHLHRAIAVATGNTVMLALFDSLNTIRRTVTWGRLRPDFDRPPPNHHSFDDHTAIVTAIEERDPVTASTRMHDHLSRVRDNLHARRTAAE